MILVLSTKSRRWWKAPCCMAAGPAGNGKSSRLGSPRRWSAAWSSDHWAACWRQEQSRCSPQCLGLRAVCAGGGLPVSMGVQALSHVAAVEPHAKEQVMGFPADGQDLRGLAADDPLDLTGQDGAHSTKRHHIPGARGPRGPPGGGPWPEQGEERCLPNCIYHVVIKTSHLHPPIPDHLGPGDFL